MIFIITKFYNDFVYECRQRCLNPKDYNNVMFLNTYVKLLGRTIKETDEIICGTLYGFEPKEWRELCTEIGRRKKMGIKLND